MMLITFLVMHPAKKLWLFFPYSFAKIYHIETRSAFIIFFLHLSDHFSGDEICESYRLWAISPSKLEDSLTGSTQADSMSNWDKEMLFLVLIGQHCFTPFFSRLSFDSYTFSFNSELVFEPSLYLALMEPINIKKSLRAADSRNIK